MSFVTIHYGHNPTSCQGVRHFVVSACMIRLSLHFCDTCNFTCCIGTASPQTRLGGNIYYCCYPRHCCCCCCCPNHCCCCCDDSELASEPADVFKVSGWASGPAPSHHLELCCHCSTVATLKFDCPREGESQCFVLHHVGSAACSVMSHSPCGTQTHRCVVGYVAVYSTPTECGPMAVWLEHIW